MLFRQNRCPSSNRSPDRLWTWQAGCDWPHPGLRFEGSSTLVVSTARFPACIFCLRSRHVTCPCSALVTERAFAELANRGKSLVIAQFLAKGSRRCVG